VCAGWSMGPKESCQSLTGGSGIDSCSRIVFALLHKTATTPRCVYQFEACVKYQVSRWARRGKGAPQEEWTFVVQAQLKPRGEGATNCFILRFYPLWDCGLRRNTYTGASLAGSDRQPAGPQHRTKEGRAPP
jgi:hypothetical protein